MDGIWAMLVAITFFFVIGIWGFWWLAAEYWGTGRAEESRKSPETLSKEEEHKKAA